MAVRVAVPTAGAGPAPMSVPVSGAMLVSRAAAVAVTAMATAITKTAAATQTTTAWGTVARTLTVAVAMTAAMSTAMTATVLTLMLVPATGPADPTGPAGAAVFEATAGTAAGAVPRAVSGARPTRRLGGRVRGLMRRGHRPIIARTTGALCSPRQN